jgi:hypothetical protein
MSEEEKNRIEKSGGRGRETIEAKKEKVDREGKRKREEKGGNGGRGLPLMLTEVKVVLLANEVKRCWVPEGPILLPK